MGGNISRSKFYGDRQENDWPKVIDCNLKFSLRLCGSKASYRNDPAKNAKKIWTALVSRLLQNTPRQSVSEGNPDGLGHLHHLAVGINRL
jgi:hypothetical protein